MTYEFSLLIVLFLSFNRWYIGKEHLNGANSDTLNLKLRKEMNLESVSCEATNSIASVRSSLQLDIRYKPYFLKGPHSYILIDRELCNKPITLDCQAESNPIANITWFKMTFNPQTNLLNKIKIGHGSTFTSSLFNCGSTKAYKINETIENNGKPETYNDIYSVNDFGLYICEANNGLIEDNRQIIVKRNIKINPLSAPAVRIALESEDENESTMMVKYQPILSTLTLSCIVDPLPEYKGIIWLRENNKFLFDTKFIIQNENQKQVDIDYEQYLIEEMENDDVSLKNFTYKVNTEVTKDGLKSFLHITLKSQQDFGLYKCRAWNRYGNREVSVTIKEDKYNISFKSSVLRIYEKYPILYIIGFCLLATFTILLISLIAICLFKHNSSKWFCFLCKNNFKKKSSGSYSNSAIGIGVDSESSGSSSSTNGVHATGVHSTSSSHISSGFNEATSDSKTIDEWLTTTSKLSNNIVTTNIKNPQPLHQPCLIVSYNENNILKSHESELLLKKSTQLANGGVEEDEDNGSDLSLNKLLSETTYRLSDLFKDLSPSLINNSNNTGENTLQRYKTSLNSKHKTTSTTDSSSSITTVTTNLSNATPSRLLSKSPRLKKASLLGTSTFLPPPPPPPTASQPQQYYQTTIHSNMKNIPYTTLSKVYTHNGYCRSKNVLSDGMDTENNKLNSSYSEYSKLSENALNKNENTFQTVV